MGEVADHGPAAAVGASVDLHGGDAKRGVTTMGSDATLVGESELPLVRSPAWPVEELEERVRLRPIVRVDPGAGDGSWEVHVVLEVTDEGEPPLTCYQRVRLRSAERLGE